ncbi:VirB3 family type IV secretion system protein [Brucella intermedia]|uniref:VirB3 family type IV secretion system protein n=1 Tax=Brucella intermedia TaxID=94625 RepID=UPI003B64246D
MLERNEIYRGLQHKPTITGLPLYEFLIWISFSGLTFMWAQTFYILIFSVVLYLLLFLGAKWDQNFLSVGFIILNKFRRNRNSGIWGGTSYEP